MCVCVCVCVCVCASAHACVCVLLSPPPVYELWFHQVITELHSVIPIFRPSATSHVEVAIVCQIMNLDARLRMNQNIPIYSKRTDLTLTVPADESCHL